MAVQVNVVHPLWLQQADVRRAARADFPSKEISDVGPIGMWENMVNPDATSATATCGSDIRQAAREALRRRPEELETVYRGRTLLGGEARVDDVAEGISSSPQAARRRLRAP
jgi:hypothetical protein